MRYAFSRTRSRSLDARVSVEPWFEGSREIFKNQGRWRAWAMAPGLSGEERVLPLKGGKKEGH